MERLCLSVFANICGCISARRSAVFSTEEYRSGAFAMVARSFNGTVIGSAASALIPVQLGIVFVVGLILASPISAADTTGLAYVTNCSDNTVSSYDVDSATSQLQHVQDLSAGKCPLSVTVHPSGRFVYVQNAGSNSLSLYSVDVVTGALTAVTTVPTGQGRSPGGAAFHPSGKFLYVANYGSDTISAYSIDPKTGVPTPLRGSPFAAGPPPGSLAVDPAGRFLYAANFDAQGVSGYAIDTTTGALARIPGSPFAAGDNPRSVGVHPSGKFAYVANFGSHDISTYRIDAVDGALREILPRVSAGIKPSSLAVHSRFVYVANMRSHDISTYRIDATTGTLHEIRPRVATVGWPEVIALYPSRGSIYATSYYDEDVLVSAFAINEATGELTRGRPIRHGKLKRQSYYSGVALSAAPTPPPAGGALRVLFREPSRRWATAAAAPLQVALILDASNSMWAQIGGERKIDLAKKALTSLIKDLPSTAQVAFRVYGHQHPRELRDCQDSTLLVPFGPLDKVKLIEQVQSITPRGMTPLAYSLKQALNDLGNAPGEKLVILVSDGKESCGGDPVAAVKALRKQGVNMRIEVMGLAIADSATKHQLNAIATLTSGRYHAAKDAPELKAALADAARLAFTVEDQNGMGVARGMIGSERLCLQPGNYRIRVRSPTQTYTFNNIAVIPGQQTHVTLTPQDEVLSESSRSETLAQPCPVPTRPSSLADSARTP
jgi:6-phosphogluconolactonase (cycloisomerase 2 family)/Mg-chelatase subunit ChlD